jgi:hypothetical protein
MGRTPEQGAVQRRMEAAVKSGAVGRGSPSGDRGIFRSAVESRHFQSRFVRFQEVAAPMPPAGKSCATRGKNETKALA